jgi:poly(3-hydroxyalkanoate) synthetase
MWRSIASATGSAASNGDWQSWSAALAAQMARLNGDATTADELHPGAAGPWGLPPGWPQPDEDLLAGIAAYRRHPWERRLADPPALWTEGGSRLLDYGAADPAARPVLFVPSLVNRAYVLDLAPGGSLLRWLAARGVRPLLLDWGWPGEVERGFSLTDYIAGRLERALAAANDAGGGKVVLAGYCMGGLLAVAAAQRRREQVSGLALLATPWDFHAPDAEQSRRLAALLPLLEPFLGFGRTMPIDVLQALFSLLDPDGIAEKYRGFAHLPQGGARARLFVAIEDWLNDGVPLAAQVARECLSGWYGRNTPALGEWRVAGLAVTPQTLTVPSFVALPARDRIVPPESARPLAALIPEAVIHMPRAGHVGMIAGSGAEAALWRPLLDWLLAL